MEKTKVKTLVRQIRGVSYKPEDLHNELDDNSVVLLRANNIDEGKINFDDVVYVDKSKVSDEQYLKYGDILICASSGSKNLVGKAASIRFNTECTFGAFCKVIRPKEGLDEYLSVYFQSPIYRRKISEVAIGVNINNIRNEHIDELDIPVFLNDEQASIVKKIHLIQEVISNRKAELEKLDDLIKARFVEMFGNPDINEKKWNEYKMEQLCEVGSSKRIYQNDQSLTGIPFLRISDLVNRMDTGSKGCDLFIPEELFGKLKKQGLVPVRGDILLTARGTLGRCYIIQDEDEFYFQDGMITWLSKYDERITPLYISYLFEMPGFRKQIDSLQAGSTVAYLSISMTKKLNVMTPPIELQNQFADFVRAVDKSKVAVQKTLEQTQTLFDSLMQKYFG